MNSFVALSKSKLPKKHEHVIGGFESCPSVSPLSLGVSLFLFFLSLL